jgi:hypothetical protein
MAFCGKRGVFLLLILLSPLWVQGQGYTAGRDVDNLVFKIAVFGPADEIFIWWGHAALIVENTRWNYSQVFDWGIFSYPGEDFLRDFLANLIRYNCSVESLNLEPYREEDRDIIVYTLDLEADKKELILAYAENNVLPENRYYNYHEFRDNCSTRVRDIIDMGTGGQFGEWAAGTPGRFSRRQHIRRFTWARPVWDWFLDFLMGQDLDEPVTLWDEMFLPVEMGRCISDFSYTDSSGAGRKLVKSVALLNASKERQPILSTVPSRWPGDLLLGLLAAALVQALRILGGKKPRAGRIVWGIFQSLAGLALGILGWILVYAQFFMKNDYIQQNINLIFVNPLPLLALPLGVMSAAGLTRFKPDKYLRVLWLVISGAGILSLLLRLFPAFFQQNQSTLALILPLTLLLSLGLPGSPQAAQEAS